MPIYFVSLFNQFVTPLTCVLIFLFGLKLGFSGRRSLLVTLVFAFGTAAWVFAWSIGSTPLNRWRCWRPSYTLFAHQERLRPAPMPCSPAWCWPWEFSLGSICCCLRPSCWSTCFSW